MDNKLHHVCTTAVTLALWKARSGKPEALELAGNMLETATAGLDLDYKFRVYGKISETVNASDGFLLMESKVNHAFVTS